MKISPKFKGSETRVLLVSFWFIVCCLIFTLNIEAKFNDFFDDALNSPQMPVWNPPQNTSAPLPLLLNETTEQPDFSQLLNDFLNPDIPIERRIEIGRALEDLVSKGNLQADEVNLLVKELGEFILKADQITEVEQRAIKIIREAIATYPSLTNEFTLNLLVDIYNKGDAVVQIRVVNSLRILLQDENLYPSLREKGLNNLFALLESELNADLKILIAQNLQVIAEYLNKEQIEKITQIKETTTDETLKQELETLILKAQPTDEKLKEYVEKLTKTEGKDKEAILTAIKRAFTWGKAFKLEVVRMTMQELFKIAFKEDNLELRTRAVETLKIIASLEWAAPLLEKEEFGDEYLRLYNETKEKPEQHTEEARQTAAIKKDGGRGLKNIVENKGVSTETKDFIVTGNGSGKGGLIGAYTQGGQSPFSQAITGRILRDAREVVSPQVRNLIDQVLGGGSPSSYNPDFSRVPVNPVEPGIPQPSLRTDFPIPHQDVPGIRIKESYASQSRVQSQEREIKTFAVEKGEPRKLGIEMKGVREVLVELLKPEISEERKEELRREIAKEILKNTKLEKISLDGLSKEFKSDEKKYIEEMVKDNLEAFIFVQMLNDKKGNQEEVLDLKNMIIKEERQAEIFKEYGVLITSADSGLLEKNLSLMGDLLGHMPREFFGGQFLGLILSSSGMLLLSSLGMLSFLEGPSFSLAEFLKLFMKFLPEKPPLKYPRKNPVPGQDYTIYFWYICFLFMLWYLMGEPGLAWAGKIPGLLKQIRFPAKGGEKILPRILVSVRAKKSIARIHRRWKQKPARESYPRIGREKSLKNIAYFRELEQDVEKRLRRTKHWARYLESLKRGK